MCNCRQIRADLIAASRRSDLPEVSRQIVRGVKEMAAHARRKALAQAAPTVTRALGVRRGR